MRTTHKRRECNAIEYPENGYLHLKADVNNTLEIMKERLKGSSCIVKYMQKVKCIIEVHNLLPFNELERTIQNEK